MILDHEAILKAYPDAVVVYDDKGAFKEDGTQITLVQSSNHKLLSFGHLYLISI